MARTQDLLHALEPEIELQKKASIHVTQTIHPNTVMTINGTTKRFSERIGGATWVQWGDDLVDHEKVSREKNIKQDAKE